MRFSNILFLLLALKLFFGNQILANDSERSTVFPLPKNLKPNVKFWIQVYAHYNDNQIIIHDSKDLNIIYEVVDLEDHSNLTDKKKWKIIEETKKKYQNILRELAKKKVYKLESLDEDERRVYELFKTAQDSDTFLTAAKRIRGQNGLKYRFKEGLIKSGKYMPYIHETFKKYGIPLELCILPHVESSFNNKAYSKFGAAGLWQFTRSTGRLYLDINYTVDDRFHPEKATEAAAKLLKESYEILGAWPLAITSYNHGINGIKRAVRQLGTTDIGEITEKYYSRQFGFASRNFYSEFLAALHVSENYRKYFGELTFEEPEKHHVINMPYYVKLSTIMNQLNITLQDVKELNPSLRRSVLQSIRRLPKGYELKIPYRENFDADIFYAQIPGYEKSNQQLRSNWYQVKRGDNLKKIAQKFNTSVKELIALNDDIQNSHKIYVNQIIQLPETETEFEKQENGVKSSPEPYVSVKEKPAQLRESDERKKWYQVKPGDNLEKIATLHKISVNELMAINKIINKNQIYSGQLLKLYDDNQVAFISSNEKKDEVADLNTAKINEVKTSTNINNDIGNYWYEIKQGDNLNKIADAHGVSLTELIKLNNIENKHQIRVGQTLIIPPKGEVSSTQGLIANKISPSNNRMYSENTATDNKPETEIKSDDFFPATPGKIKKRLPLDQASFSIVDEIYVLPDETLGHLADWLEIPTQKLRDLNSIDFSQEIQLGQRIKIIYLNVRKEEFLQRRMEYHRGIEEDFFNSYSIQGVQTHKLKRGENIWYLSNEVYELPYWLLVKYNPNTNFDQLRMGDEIIIPIITAIDEN